VSFQVLTEESMKTNVFWDVAMCKWSTTTTQKTVILKRSSYCKLNPRWPKKTGWFVGKYFLLVFDKSVRRQFLSFEWLDLRMVSDGSGQHLTAGSLLGLRLAIAIQFVSLVRYERRGRCASSVMQRASRLLCSLNPELVSCVYLFLINWF
jgi:hypothetical protein